MNSQDIKKLQGLLENIKLSPAEMGEVYAELASLYLKINNQLLDFYNSFLERSIIDLKALNSREKELT